MNLQNNARYEKQLKTGMQRMWKKRIGQYAAGAEEKHIPADLSIIDTLRADQFTFNQKLAHIRHNHTIYTDVPTYFFYANGEEKSTRVEFNTLIANVINNKAPISDLLDYNAKLVRFATDIKNGARSAAFETYDKRKDKQRRTELTPYLKYARWYINWNRNHETTKNPVTLEDATKFITSVQNTFPIYQWQALSVPEVKAVVRYWKYSTARGGFVDYPVVLDEIREGILARRNAYVMNKYAEDLGYSNKKD